MCSGGTYLLNVSSPTTQFKTVAVAFRCEACREELATDVLISTTASLVCKLASGPVFVPSATSIFSEGTSITATASGEHAIHFSALQEIIPTEYTAFTNCLLESAASAESSLIVPLIMCFVELEALNQLLASSSINSGGH